MGSIQAVIEIGSTGIRMLVAETTDDKKRNILDRSEFPANIGRDVFTSRYISRDTLLNAQRILNRFGEQLAAWGLTREETLVLGTSAVREALNRDPFVDRIKVKTGFTVRVIDGIEENRLMYIAVTECLKEESFSVQQSNSIILDLSGGATEMMLMEKGSIVGAHSLRLGTVIIGQQIHSMTGNTGDAIRFVTEFINNTRATLNAEMNLDKVQQFIALGKDMQIASIFAGKSVSTFLWEIERDRFDAFVDEVEHYSEEECVARFKMSYNEAKTFLISLLTYRQFISLTNVKTIVVPETSIREGALIALSGEGEQELRKEFSEQIVASARTLLRKYKGDESHAEYVRNVSCRLFDKLESELGLDAHARMLLEVSALLHDIGMFIRTEDHNLHSCYIIRHSEIFGLTADEMNLVALIALYHKGKVSPQNEAEVKLLPRASRLTILKLCAILRVADSFDRSHRQRFRDFSISLSKDSITFRIKGHEHMGLERLALQEKSDLFEDVFGYNVVLV
ncbi:MAG: HD domain-containing protein, partial [Treponema sp.]|nr:HD domain-containing protein [Treponema sp.]